MHPSAMLKLKSLDGPKAADVLARPLRGVILKRHMRAKNTDQKDIR